MNRLEKETKEKVQNTFESLERDGKVQQTKNMSPVGMDSK